MPLYTMVKNYSHIYPASQTSAISFEPIFKACDFLFGARVAFWLVSDNAFFQIAFNIIMPDYNYAIFKWNVSLP